MIEIIILNYLGEKLDYPVLMEEPEEELQRYVLIEKTGGRIENYIHHATLAIQSYAESKHEAAILNEQVKDVMNMAAVMDSIGSSKLNSDYEFTDTTKKQYRYQAVYDLVY